MQNKIKIVTIGGGSSYTPELIEGLILRKDRLPIAELWLVDIADGAEKMEIVGNMAKRMIAAAGLDWQVHLTLDRKAALKDADYVTTQFRVGLLDARLKDEVIPLANGLLGQETNGAGGLFKAFRTIPVILEIIDDMRVLCPNAWLVDFTNPAGMVTEAAIKYGQWEKTVGLCNVPFSHITQACELLETPEAELNFKFAGLNHFHWHRVWDNKGNERTAELIDKIYAPEQRDRSDEGLKNIHQIPFHYEQVKHLGILPCGYHRYYYLQEPMLAHAVEEFRQYETRAEVVKKTEKRLFELYKDVNLNYKPEELSQRGGAHYSDAACDLIAAIQNNTGKQMVVSTRNNGAIADLPFDCIVEVTAAITAHGPEPLRWGALPPAARGMIQLMKAMEETTIEAAVTGDYGAALHAFTINPLIPAGDTAIKVLDALLYAHKAYLPKFAEKIAQIERDKPEIVAFVDQLLADREAHA
ncbi:6-phospho-beta-glucosidase [Erwinia persicina]|uniref:6-phospho-beta-glucosidase n=1 Tax=Erwinia TaxID=551 RepID=UPI00209F25BD|nr:MULTISPECIES: 6-phospho-beta-glucosidase [Erwinia]MCP1437282.1 6-phospho-beta-glucosidase [Erwinia persicina]MDN4627157.1 6-phospho-beta-glucosidase [Erwinia sp. PsM31]